MLSKGTQIVRDDLVGRKEVDVDIRFLEDIQNHCHS